MVCLGCKQVCSSSSGLYVCWLIADLENRFEQDGLCLNWNRSFADVAKIADQSAVAHWENVKTLDQRVC